MFAEVVDDDVEGEEIRVLGFFQGVGHEMETVKSPERVLDGGEHGWDYLSLFFFFCLVSAGGSGGFCGGGARRRSSFCCCEDIGMPSTSARDLRERRLGLLFCLSRPNKAFKLFDGPTYKKDRVNILARHDMRLIIAGTS